MTEPAAQGRVLVADDDEGVRLVAQASLRRAGFQVAVTVDGDEAASYIERDGAGIAAVLLDLTMPGMTDRSALRRINAHRPELPIILTSGYPEPDVRACLREGAIVHFLPKPFLLSALVTLVQSVVAGAGAGADAA